MTFLMTVMVCLFAGLGAGLGTGLAGLSAAAVVSPMLITFLDIPAYQAIGIALASDVLASAVSAFTYWKNKNIDFKLAILISIFGILGAILGANLSLYTNVSVLKKCSFVSYFRFPI